jgi:hypothetical protein
MYKKLLELTKNYPDVQRVFLNLQRASQQNHLPAFQRAAGLRTNFQDNSVGQRGKGRQYRGGRGRFQHCCS